MAENKNENQQSQNIITEPTGNGRYDKYIEWWDAGKLQNADINISQYWDDSSAKNYDNPDLRWWENRKYTWENTLNSQVAYNPNATVEWLDPNYKYWQAAQMQNSQDANYIARRNDEIASALYNAWRTSVEDVENFLSGQKGWDYSTNNERRNTVLSVWKRLGQIEAQNQKNNEQPTETNKTPKSENNEDRNSALNDMESDLNKSTAWELYGKVTADQSTAIKTLEDENSVYRSMNASRIQSFKNLQSMDSNSIASAIINGVMATDSQQMRDLMQYDPAKYQEVKQAEKQIRGQMNINTITSGEWDFNTVATKWQSGISNEITDFALNSSNWVTSTADILKSVNSSLSSNQSAATASEQMATIEADMATLQNRMKNLKKEASQVFKWDVPQYIVNAYVANRTAEIQDQLSILENRYNAAQSRYQNEWEQTKWKAEFDLKKEELQLKKESMALDDWATRQWIAIDWAKLTSKTTSTSTTVNWNTVQTTSLSREEINTSIDDLVQKCKDWQLWNAQCAAWIQKYYLPTLWVDLWSLSAYSAKQGICNQLAWEYTPQKWDVVVMSSPTKPENWHIGIVVGIDWDTMTYLDWNGSVKDWVWTEEPAIRTTKLSNSRIYGYYDPTKWQSQSSESFWAYNPAYSEIYGRYLQGKFAAWKQLATQAAAMWMTPKELDMQAKAWKEAQNNNQDASTRLQAIAQLLNMSWENRLWRILSAYDFPKLISSWYADWDSAYNFIRDNITFDKLLELKKNWATFWALSDNELRAIWAAATNLNRNMSNDEFQRQLTWIYNELLRWMGETKKLTTEQIKASYTWNSSMPSSTKRTKTSTNTASTTRWEEWTMSASDKAKALQWF